MPRPAKLLDLKQCPIWLFRMKVYFNAQEQVLTKLLARIVAALLPIIPVPSSHPMPDELPT